MRVQAPKISRAHQGTCPRGTSPARRRVPRCMDPLSRVSPRLQGAFHVCWLAIKRRRSDPRAPPVLLTSLKEDLPRVHYAQTLAECVRAFPPPPINSCVRARCNWSEQQLSRSPHAAPVYLPILKYISNSRASGRAFLLAVRPCGSR